MKLYTTSPFIPVLTDNYSISTETPLPVKFMSVDVSTINNINVVSWKTASAINNDIFEIERSTNGQTWEVARIIPGAGHSSEVLSYSFEDQATAGEITFYRIKQTDFDGQFDYSDIVKTGEVSNTSKVYPNPLVSNELYVVTNKETTDISVTNISGQQILFAYTPSSGKVTFDSDLEKGIYFVTVDGTVNRIIKF